MRHIWITLLIIVSLSACQSEDEQPSIAVNNLPTPTILSKGTIPNNQFISDTLPDSHVHQWVLSTTPGDQIQLDISADGWIPLVDIPALNIASRGNVSIEFTAEQATYDITIAERYGGGDYQIATAQLNPPTPTPRHSPSPIPTQEDIVLGTGDVQITLRWTTLADLDLHVTDPSGFEIFFADPASPTQGELDVDANFPCNTRTTRPVENVFWPPDNSPEGSYRVSLHYHPSCGNEGTTDYEIIINIEGQEPQVLTGSISYEQFIDIITFQKN